MPKTHEIAAYAQRLILEFNRARKLLRKYFKKRHDPDDAQAKIKEIIDNMTAKQSKIIGYTLNDAFRGGAKEGNKEISNATILAAASSASIGFDLTKVADADLNRITAKTIGDIGKYNTQLSKQLTLQYNMLLADNKLVYSLTQNGWTPWLDKTLEKRGISPVVIALVKGQTTTAKMISILEREGIRGGHHPREVSKMLLPHIQRHFGPEGVVIDNVGKFKKVLKVDADGNFKYVKQAVTRPYRATPKVYSNLLARTSMIQAHHEGRYQSLQKTGLVDHYISVSVLGANTCNLCATMHGQRVTYTEGPLYHPSCACDLKPIYKKDSGLKNKDPSYYGNQRDQHFWKQHQLAEYNKHMPKGAKLKFHSMLPKDTLKAMPDKAAMRTIRYNMMGKPGAIKPRLPISKPKVVLKEEIVKLEDMNKMKPGDKLKIDSLRNIVHRGKGADEWVLNTNTGMGYEMVKRFPTKESLYKYVNGEISDIKFKAPVVYPKKIPIRPVQETKYGGADMNWTEVMTSSGKTKEDMFAYHYSYQPIKAFAQKTTCCVDEIDYRNFTEIGYRIKIPKGTYVEYFNQEVRVNLEDYPNLIIQKLKPGWCPYSEVKG